MIMSDIHHVPAKAEWDRYETARRAISGKISSAAPQYNVRQHKRLSASWAVTFE
jgi:uncharacterized protein